MPYYDIEKLRKMPVHFVIGTGRSGTTLLSTIFNANPQVFCAPETRIIMTYYAKYGKSQKIPTAFAKDLNKHSGAKLINRNQTKSQANNVWTINTEMITNFNTEDIAKYDYSTICKQLLLNVQIGQRTNESVEILLDKQPDYTFYVKELLSIFPNAKFIITQRDYRAFALSQKESPSNKNEIPNIVGYAYTWNSYNQEIKKILQNYPKQVLLVKYEDLVANTSQVLQNISELLDISINNTERNTETQNQLKTNELTNREAKKLIDLTKPINTDRLNVWRNRLSTKEIKTLDLICGTTGQYFGYQPINKVGFFEKVTIYFTNIHYLIFFKILLTLLVRYYYYYPIVWRAWLVRRFGFSR